MFADLKRDAKASFLGDSAIYLASTGYVLGTMFLTHFGVPFAALLLFPLIMGMIARMATPAAVVNQPSVLSYYLNPDKLWRSILTYLVPGFIVFLIWLPTIFLLALSIFLSLINGIVSLIALLFTLCLLMLVVYKSIQYTMVPYVMVVNKKMGIFEAIKESKAFVKGKLIRITLLQFSFIGWHILCFFTFGFMYIWLTPYIHATMLEFYRTERTV